MQPDEGHVPIVVYGSNKADQITSMGGPQTIYALNGPDEVYAGGGPDKIHGGRGNDRIFAQGGPDEVNGGNGDDYLHGGGGPDQIFGGNGNDVLVGCVAADILTGGRGADVFVYRSANEAPAHGEADDQGDNHTNPDGGDHDGGTHDDGCGGDNGEPGQETITDFKPGTDQIDFSAIGTVGGLSDGPAANSIWAIQQGADVMLYVDTNGTVDGDHPAEMSILLLGVEAATLTIDDFILL
jgi:Ca2+-binding RTX toxin-like protein